MVDLCDLRPHATDTLTPSKYALFGHVGTEWIPGLRYGAPTKTLEVPCEHETWVVVGQSDEKGLCDVRVGCNCSVGSNASYPEDVLLRTSQLSAHKRGSEQLDRSFQFAWKFRRELTEFTHGIARKIEQEFAA